jgi:hypothetical protein
MWDGRKYHVYIKMKDASIKKYTEETQDVYTVTFVDESKQNSYEMTIKVKEALLLFSDSTKTKREASEYASLFEKNPKALKKLIKSIEFSP